MSDLRRGRGDRNNDRPRGGYNKHEEGGGGYGRRERRDRRRDGDRDGEYKDRYHDKERRYNDEGGHGNRERRDRNDRNGGRNRRNRDEPYESRRDRPRKEEQPVHNPKLFFNSKRPADGEKGPVSAKQEKSSLLNRRKEV